MYQDGAVTTVPTQQVTQPATLSSSSTYAASPAEQPVSTFNISDRDANNINFNTVNNLPFFGSPTTSNNVKVETASVPRTLDRVNQNGDSVSLGQNANNIDSLKKNMTNQIEVMKQNFKSFYNTNSMAQVIRNSLAANPNFAGSTVMVMPKKNPLPEEIKSGNIHEVAIYGPGWNNITEPVLAAYYEAVANQNQTELA